MNPAAESARLFWAAAAVFGVNLPFGWLRAGASRFSPRWILYVHLPVPIVVTVRLLLGLGWHWTTYPVLIAAYAAGQLAGGRLRGRIGR